MTLFTNSTLPSQCNKCSTLRENLTKEVLLQFWDYWKHTIWVWFAQEPLSLRDLCQDGEILQLNWNNTISTRRLDYMLWPWFERVASYGSVYQVNRFLQTAFYVSWHIVRLFTMDEKKLVYYHQTPKCFLRTSPAWSSPWTRCRCSPSGLRRWRKILQLLNMLFPPRWDEHVQFSCEYENMDKMDVYWWWHERDLAQFNMLIIMIMVHWAKIKR